MLKTILVTALAALVVLLIYAATRPDTFRVERSERIKAQPDKIFALINDLHRFNTWNPYEKKDPAIKGQYGGSASGPGASYARPGKLYVQADAGVFADGQDGGQGLRGWPGQPQGHRGGTLNMPARKNWICPKRGCSGCLAENQRETEDMACRPLRPMTR